MTRRSVMEPKTGPWSIVNLAERYSRATPGNIDVRLSVAGLPIERSAA
jgi:hypothetical protein